MLATKARSTDARSSVLAQRARREAVAGFTLIELMTVVVIMGVLAALATYGVRKYVLEAKRGESVAMLTQIRSAEEAYRDERFVYLGRNDFDMWTPTNTPGGKKSGWDSGPADEMRSMFAQLGVAPDGPVEYSYAVVQGTVGGTIPLLPMSPAPVFPAPTGPYYIAVAMADLNNDGSYTYSVAHSDTNVIAVDDKY